jgi:hypothetical protein
LFSSYAIRHLSRRRRFCALVSAEFHFGLGLVIDHACTA